MGNDGILDINANQLNEMLDGAIRAHLYEESPLTANNWRTLERNESIYDFGYSCQPVQLPTETLDETIKRIVEEEIKKAMGKHSEPASQMDYRYEKYHMKHK